ncbi:unnamed protein product [Rotaria socialis]|uniref:Berberine/berberine-like domain-containing protein n=2 Tax=Rotaria socialis TaxID=392032 RepID=A0A817YIH8_9BILA|nr:unnamed protein product [Rotaria socialis]
MRSRTTLPLSFNRLDFLPNSSDWQILNASVDGRLISAQPSAAVCESTPPNVDACNIAKAQWSNASWRSDQYVSCIDEAVSYAVRVGAGVQWGEVYAWLAQYNLIAIGGASSTVGAAGGYLQGGADGQRRTVNDCQNADLFWALRGGDGGTFAIVLSVVLRAFPSPSILVTYYNFAAPNEDRYATFLRDFIRLITTLADDGWSGYFYISDTNISTTLVCPNSNITKVNETFDKFLNNNTDLQIIHPSALSFPSFYEFFYNVFTQYNPAGINVLLGSRLIPESIVRNQPDQLAKIFNQIKGQSHNQSILVGHLVAGGQVSHVRNTSANPVWRTSLLHMAYAQFWPDGTSLNDQQKHAEHVRNQVNILQTMVGGDQSGCYMNEADPNEPDWQQKYFGTQAIYDRLKTIKQTVDPSGLFICRK